MTRHKTIAALLMMLALVGCARQTIIPRPAQPPGSDDTMHGGGDGGGGSGGM